MSIFNKYRELGKQAALEKVAFLGALNPLNWVGAATAGTEQGINTSKAEANAAGILSNASKETRVKDLGEYLINPAALGPLSEGVNALKRRHYASKVEDPVATSLIPFYGMANGGKEGLNKRAFINAAGVIPGVLSSMDGGNRAARARAAASGEIANSANDARDSSMLQYLADPSVNGPVSELLNRLQRRHSAAVAEAPFASNVVLGLGSLRGGKAGLKNLGEDNNALGSSVHSTLDKVRI